MDVVNFAALDDPPPSRERTTDDSDPAAAPPTPIENRLSMPAQNLFKFDARQRRKPEAPWLWRTPWLARIMTFGGGFALTAYGAHEMYKVVDVGGVTTLKWALLALFVLNFPGSPSPSRVASSDSPC